MVATVSLSPLVPSIITPAAWRHTRRAEQASQEFNFFRLLDPCGMSALRLFRHGVTLASNAPVAKGSC